MVRKLGKSCLVLLVLLSATLPCAAWKFVSMADSRGEIAAVNAEVFKRIIKQVNAEKPDLVIFQGDAVSGSKDTKKLSEQMDNWLSYMKRLNCPWYFVPGNHEIRSATAESILRTKIDQPLNGPPGHEELVFSFDHKDAHFVGLNSNHYKGSHKVQLSWLEEDLKATRKPHIFVMAHEPAYPAGPHAGSSLDAYPHERDAFWKLLERYGVRIYFCGHEHLYKRSRHGNVFQVINGTCGAPIYKGGVNTIPTYHYVVVDVKGPRVYCQAKDLNGKVLDSWEYSISWTPDTKK